MAASRNFLYIYVLAFFSGMCIMGVELSASRLVAPFFGTSTFVWTNVIGIIMVALSLGYVVGGKLADRKPNLDVLLKLLLVACAFLIIVPFVSPFVIKAVSWVMKHFNSSFTYIFFGSLIAIALLFSIPIFLMGMTSPFLIRLISDGSEVGSSAGRIFGISTIGSIIGTFLPILVFIPAFGTAKTILFFALLLMGVTAAGFKKKRYIVLSVIVSVIFLASPVPSARKQPGLIHATESAYEYIEVVDDGSYRYLTYNNVEGFQTVLRKDSPVTGYYFDYYSLLPFLSGRPDGSLCLIGLGGGIIANQVHYFHEGMKVDAVEIDPKVISIAREYFALSKRTRVFNQDGRIFLSLSSNKYDIIIVDAFTQQIYIPFHLTTENFFALARQNLNRGGLLAMNMASFSDDSRLLKSISNTLLANFEYVYRIKIPDSDNSLIIASDNEVDFSKLSSAMNTELYLIAGYSMRVAKRVHADPNAPVLTDDKAPIEHMVDWELL